MTVSIRATTRCICVKLHSIAASVPIACFRKVDLSHGGMLKAYGMRFQVTTISSTVTRLYCASEMSVLTDGRLKDSTRLVSRNDSEMHLSYSKCRAAISLFIFPHLTYDLLSQ